MKHKKRRKHRRHKRRMSGDTSLAPNVIGSTRRRRRKKSHAVTRKRRRKARVGYVTGSEMGDVLAGYAAGIAVNIVANKFAPAMITDNIKKYAGAGLGTAAVVVGTMKKKPALLGFGLGFGTPGVMAIARDMGIVSGGMDEFISGMGIGKGEDTMLIEMNGVRENSTNLIGNPNNELNPPVVNGEDEETKVSGQFMSGSSNTLPSIISGY